MTLGLKGFTKIRRIFVSISVLSILLSTKQLGWIDGSLSSSSSVASFEWADPSQSKAIAENEESPETTFHLNGDKRDQTSTSVDKSTWYSTDKPSKPRMLVGIFSQLNDVEERQRRHLIRHTYLRFDVDHPSISHHQERVKSAIDTTGNPTEIQNRMCSLAEFQQRHRNSSTYKLEDPCQLIYAFVIVLDNDGDPEDSAPITSPNENVLNSVVTNASAYFSSSSSSSTNYPNDDCMDDDMIFFKPFATKAESEQGVSSALRAEVIASWYKHFLHGPQSTLPIDNVAYTDTKVAILPSYFWKNSIFGQEHNKSVSPSPPPSFLYAGIQVQKSNCQSSTCPSLQGDYVMRRWVCLSRSLVEKVLELLLDMPSTKPAVMITSAKRKRPESVDVTIANLVHGLVKTDQQSLDLSVPYQAVDLHGVYTNMKAVNTQLKASATFHSKTGASGLLGDYLAFWDRYKDPLTSYRHPGTDGTLEYKPGDTGAKRPSMLMGIFTMDSAKDSRRREMIRKTWLSSHDSKTSVKRLCSMKEWLVDGSGCQLVYTFVIGGNPEGPTELLDYNSSYPMTIPCRLKDEREQVTEDITCLNIRENMEEGKSQTWLKYATTVLEDHGYFDYVGKMDSDTLLYPEIFFKHVLQRLQKYPDNARVYGGDYRFKPPNMVGPVYMGGHLYFVSSDLAAWVVSPSCPRSAVDKGIEDVSIGNFVHSHPLPIRRIRLFTNEFDHPVKRIDRYRTLWRKYKARRKH